MEFIINSDAEYFSDEDIEYDFEETLESFKNRVKTIFKGKKEQNKAIEDFIAENESNGESVVHELDYRVDDGSVIAFLINYAGQIIGSIEVQDEAICMNDDDCFDDTIVTEFEMAILSKAKEEFLLSKFIR